MTPPPPPFDVELLLEQRDFLRAIARALVGDDRADDVVQATWLRALEHPPRRTGALRGWLARVARNVALNERRHEGQRPDRERQAARPESLRGEERDLELEQHVVEAVRSLEQPYRSTVYLRFYKGLGPTEIAQELGVPVATVKTRLQRGLDKLRADLDRRHGGSRREWSLALVALALPELLPSADGLVSIGAVLKGLVLMHKSLAAAGAAAAVLAVAGVAWFATRDDGATTPSSTQPAVAQVAALSSDAPDAALDAPVAQDEPRAASSAAAPERVALEAPPAAAPRASQDDGIVGRVVDESGRPVEGALVRATASAGLVLFELDSLALDAHVDEQATTGADGRFWLPAHEDGGVQLIVEAAGFAPFRKELTAYYDRSTDAGDLQLERGVLLSGRVVDTSGRPIEGARIRSSAARRSANVITTGALERVAAVTASDGSFLVDRQAVGPWTLYVESDEHPTQVASGETSARGQRVADLRIVLDDGYTIAGHVAGAPQDAGPLWVRVRPVDEGRRPGNRGVVMLSIGGGGMPTSVERVVPVGPGARFEVHGLAAGKRYLLTAFDRDGGFGGRARTESIEAIPGNLSVVLPWSVGATIAFQLVDARTGAAVEHATVSAGLRFPRPVAPDGENRHPGGLVVIDDLRVEGDGATARVKIQAQGYADWERTDVRVLRDQRADLGTIALDPVPMTYVTVADESGAPVAGAQVRLMPAPEPGEDGSVGRTFERRIEVDVDAASGHVASHTDFGALRRAVTDKDGVAALTSLPGERVQIEVAADRFADYRSGPVVLPEKTDLRHSARLAHGGTVALLVVDAAGEPVAGARVQHRGPADSEIEAERSRSTDSEGRVWFRHLETGVHGFRLAEEPQTMSADGAVFAFTMPGAGAPWTETAVADAEVELVLSTAEQSLLYGEIRENGEPLVGADVRLETVGEEEFSFPGLGVGPRAKTDADGRYELADVDAGEYELVIEHPTRAVPARHAVEVRSGENRFDVDLDVAIVRGRVVDEEGVPLAGVLVSAERYQPAGPRRSFVAIAVTDDGSDSGASVSVSHGDERANRAETNAEGYYELRGVPSGTRLVVKARAADFSPATSEPFEVAPFEERSGVDVSLRRGATLVVEVFSADGSPARNALVNARPRTEEGEPRGEPTIQLTNAQGIARFGDLSVGRWLVSAGTIGAGPIDGSVEPKEIELVGGQEGRLRFDLP